MKKTTALGAAVLLSAASIGAQAQVQALNDTALSEISGQGVGLYTGLVEGTGPFIAKSALHTAVGAGAMIATPTAVALATGLNLPLAAAVYLAGPAIAATALVATPAAMAVTFIAAPVVATGALIQGRIANGADGTGIRNAAGVMIAGSAALLAMPVIGAGVAATALAANGPAAAATWAAGPVIAAGALTAGAALTTVAGAGFIHSSAHVVGRMTHNGIQMVGSHIHH